MRDLVEITNFIQRRPDQKLILCTLVRKSGSSYRGVGSKKVIALSGETSGLLSGGCLENAIEMSAKEKFKQLPYVESFSTLADEDRLLGYQTGCKGVIDVLFEEVDREKLYLQIPFGVPRLAVGVEVSLEGPTLGQRKFVKNLNLKDENALVEKWISPLHLVLIGCGADADAYLPIARSLGWSVQLIDYRGDLATAERFPGENVQHLAVDKIAQSVSQGTHVAVVLMTHNYEADMEILLGMKEHRIGYLGCLGPFTRYERLQKDLLNLHDVKLAQHLKSVVSAPIGLFTHCNSPETIALSVIAQIQERLIETKSANVWTMILAAGDSKRFKGVKALAQWRGNTLIARALKTANAFSGSSTMVVKGGHAEQIAPDLAGTHQIWNELWSEGMGTSIAKGVTTIRRLDPNVAFIIVLPVDQPFVDDSHLNELLRESQKTGRCVLTAGENYMGPPAIIPRKFFERAEALTGERGLKSTLGEGEWAVIAGDEAAVDLDTPEELEIYR
ncbi:MAG: NTP transferase domain-containing protein [Bdellovibrionaceae bacterium]|nr:NTP transferase domain-containing protein [Pseudobdellovibrionaceae bacterium]